MEGRKSVALATDYRLVLLIRTATCIPYFPNHVLQPDGTRGRRLAKEKSLGAKWHQDQMAVELMVELHPAGLEGFSPVVINLVSVECTPQLGEGKSA